MAFVPRLTSAILLGSLALAAVAQEHTKDSVDVIKKALADKKAVLFDVREKTEWDDGHLRDAHLLPLSRLKKGVSAEELAKILPRDKAIYLHCAAGGRCLKAAEILKKEGYDVRAVKEGYKDLVKVLPKAE